MTCRRETLPPNETEVRRCPDCGIVLHSSILIRGEKLTIKDERCGTCARSQEAK